MLIFDVMWVFWVFGKLFKFVVFFFFIFKFFGFGRVYMINSGFVENMFCGMCLELVFKLIFFVIGRYDIEVFCFYFGWVGWLWMKFC